LKERLWLSFEQICRAIGLPRPAFSPEEMSDAQPSISTQLPLASDGT
jgi:hypothetical protein